MEGIDADLIRGEGRLRGEREVAVTAAHGFVCRLTASRAIVLATGSRASSLPVDGLADIRTWDNRDVTTVKDIPQRLLILGGGVAGCELAQAYRRHQCEDGVVMRLVRWSSECYSARKDVCSWSSTSPSGS